MNNNSFENEIFHDGAVLEIKTVNGLTNNITGGTYTDSMYVIEEEQEAVEVKPGS